MEREVRGAQKENPAGVMESSAQRLLAQAVLLSAHAREELSTARSAREEAERYREEAEAEAAKAMEELWQEAQTEIQAAVDQAHKARKEAEEDRARARQEIEQARAIRLEAEEVRSKAREEYEQAKLVRLEAERISRQLQEDAKRQGEQMVRDLLLQAETQAAEIRQRAAEEVRKIIEDINTLRIAAEEELEARRLLTAAARIRAQAQGLRAKHRLNLNQIRLSNHYDESAQPEELEVETPSQPAPRKASRTAASRV